MGNSDKFLAGLIAGAVVGAVASLLLAPKTGKETRKLLKEQAEQLGERAKGLGNIVGKRPGSSKDEERAGNGASAGREA